MSPLGGIQRDLMRVLNALAYFADITVIRWRPRLKADGTVETAPVIQSKIDLALSGISPKAGKAGLTAIVLMPVVQVPNPEAPGPECSIATSIRLKERTLINMGALGTLKPAEDAAWELQRELHNYSLGGDIGTLYCDGTSIAPVLDPTDTSGDVIYNVEVIARCAAAMPTRCAHVAFSGTTAPLTLTCATAGASIYYTLNEDFPAAGVPGAVLYSAPFSPPVGSVVRAAAHKTGLSPSHVTERTTTA